MRRVKTAVIGAGFMGKVHAEAIRRLGNVDIVACCRCQRAGRCCLRRSRLVSNVRPGDYRELLADPAIEAVHVCTPNALHFPVSKAALEAGKAVLCEKPLSMSVAEAQEMVDLAAAKNLPNCVNHNLALLPGRAADPAHDRGRRTGRHSGRPGHVLAGLAALRHRLQLAHRESRERRPPRRRRHRVALDGSGPAPHRLRRSRPCAPTSRSSTRPARSRRRRFKRSPARRFVRKITKRCRSRPRTSEPCSFIWAIVRAELTPSAR